MATTLAQFHQDILHREAQKAALTLNLWSLRVDSREIPDSTDYRVALQTFALYRNTHPNVILARVEYWIEQMDSINQDAFEAFVDAYGTLRTLEVLPT